uniref:Basic tail secreted protein n=1 Tax=Rhipicephalus appendiculatus TaxID=34631 RepID=A0A131YQH2_RHIAP
MWTFTQFCAILFVLTSNYGTSQRYWPPSCEVILAPNYPRKNCYYRCITANRQWFKGTLQDGTPCVMGKFPGRKGQCIRGVCTTLEDEGPKFNSTINQRCDGHYNGKGYAPKCVYKCTRSGKQTQMKYHDGTPCVVLEQDEERVISAGICLKGVCTPHYSLEKTYPTMMKKVFPLRLHKCVDKDHYGRNILGSCYYYCQRNSQWFFGHYMSTYNSACEMVGPGRFSGYCCEGKCIRQANCGQDVDDMTARLGSNNNI